MDAIERLEALLGVMDATQGEDSAYSSDARLGIERIKELENELVQARVRIKKLEDELFKIKSEISHSLNW